MNLPVVSNTAFSSRFTLIKRGVGQHKTAVLDIVIVCDEFYYKRLITTYAITNVIKVLLKYFNDYFSF